MSQNVTHQLIESHLLDGEMRTGARISIRIDQTLTQDATGTLVMLALEAMKLDRVKTELSAQYVDHNLLQADYKNADDHLFLESACRRFGVWYSRPGNGVSHPIHMQRFGKPGATLLGSDSHTCAAGSLGMLAIGAGGLDVAVVMAGESFHLRLPEIWGVRLVGRLQNWVSAKDVILEMLRRHGVKGGLGRIIEYHGPGLAGLSSMDRHVIANIGAELGATTSVFPSDEETRRFLRGEGREEAWTEVIVGADANYDLREEIDLSSLEPLIAKPSSPGNVVPVREVEGEPVYQTYIGSSANCGYRDFAIAAHMVRGRQIASRVSFDINPTSRRLLETLMRDGLLGDLVHAGARLHQSGCNGCIGMGQAPATGRNSLRTVPRNFPGRSGTQEDSVFLCSPETATAAALVGRIADPRRLGIPYPEVRIPEGLFVNCNMLQPSLDEESARAVEIVKGPNIAQLPDFDPLPDTLRLPVLLKVGDNISTDEIMPAGAQVLPYRSNIPHIADFAFDAVDESYSDRALEVREDGGHAVGGGENYGQGSSREHAALAPRYLGLRLVVAKSFARIHLQNLINHVILPLHFVSREDYDQIEPNEIIEITDLHGALRDGKRVTATLKRAGNSISLAHDLTERHYELLLAGGLLNWAAQRT